jgi:hypothetical protein
LKQNTGGTDIFRFTMLGKRLCAATDQFEREFEIESAGFTLFHSGRIGVTSVLRLRLYSESVPKVNS